MNFKSKIKPQNPEKNKRKMIVLRSYVLFGGRDRVLHAFESEIFPKKLKVEFLQI